MTLTVATDLTKKMMKAFSDNPMPTSFLSSLFGKNPSELYISDSEAVEIDIERNGERIAVDVKKGGDGNLNLYGKYSTKLYVPPTYNEYTNVSASQLTKRQPGQDPYKPVNMTANAMAAIFKTQFDSTKKIARAIEYQASQALFNGTIVFKNADDMDFKRKSTHNITSAVLWSEATADPIADLAAGCTVNKKDGKVQSDVAIFGIQAWDTFLKHANVKAALDNRRIEIGNITPKFSAKGSTFQAIIWAGSYKLECYTYDQYFEAEDTTITPYVPVNQVCVLYSGARLNKIFGAVEILKPATAAYKALGIANVPTFEVGSIVPYSYNVKEANLVAGVKSAPILVPTQIDAICNLNVLA